MNHSMPFGKEHVYIMHDGHAVKIGRAVDVSHRQKCLQTGNPRHIRVLFSAGLGRFSCDIEAALHRRFSDKRGFGEWFFITPDDALHGLVLCSRSFIGAPLFCHQKELLPQLKRAVQREDAERSLNAECAKECDL